MRRLLAIVALLIVLGAVILILPRDDPAPGAVDPPVDQAQAGEHPALPRTQDPERAGSARSKVSESTPTQTGSANKRLGPSLLIEGVVLDPKGAPIPAARIEAFGRRSSTRPVESCTCDGRGRFRIAVPEEGRYTLLARDSRQGQDTRRLLSRDCKTLSGEENVRIQLVRGSAGEIHALLTGSLEIEVPARVLVHVKPIDGQPGFHARLVDCPQGRMKLLAVPPGDYQLVLFVKGLVLNSPVARVRDRQITDLGRIYLRPLGRISGVITDGQGRPLEGVGVFPGRGYNYQRGRAWSLGSLRPSTKTDAQGRFRTSGFRKPWTPVAFAVDGHAPIEVHLTSADQASTLRLRMEASATLVITGLPPFPERKGGRFTHNSLTIKATDLPRSYRLIESGVLHTKGIQSSVKDPAEGITIPDLPPGRYEIRIDEKWCLDSPCRKVQLSAGKTKRLSW